MIAIFARSNHPVGYGYGPWTKEGVGRAHGFVVVGIRCRNRQQVLKAIDFVNQEGLDLPDTWQGQNIYPYGKPERAWDRNLWSDKVVRWYSGGPSDWDYLFTIGGNVISPDSRWPYAGIGSIGDNRFALIFEYKELISGLRGENLS